MSQARTRPVSQRRLERLLWKPSGQWTVFGLLMMALTACVLFQGYARHAVGGSSTIPVGTSRVVALPGAGPIVDLSGRKVRSVSPTAGQVALTFDDGPDPTWTPRILAVLARHHVRATFFVVGSAALQHSGLIRAELAAGDDVGSHTFSHADLGRATGTRAALELSLTQTALAGSAHVNTALLRLPYSSTTAGMTASQYHAAKDAARYGYLTVFATRDSRDWTRPGVPTIVGNALPTGGQGAVVMLHDGGGDRAQTLAALGPIIDQLSARGDRFVTVSQMIGISHRAVDPPVGRGARWQGLGLIWALRVSEDVTSVVVWLMVPLSVLSLGRAGVSVVLARRHARKEAGRSLSEPLPPLTVIVPAFNEEVGIAGTLRSIEASQYPDFDVVVVDDGSTDGTAEVVEALSLPHTRLVRQANAGKAAALNTGLAQSTNPIVVMVDGDTVFEPTTLSWLASPFVDDPRVGAVSGNTKVGNRNGILGRWQHIEYVIGFNLDRRTSDILHWLATVPGAAGAFRRQALDEVGGVPEDTLAEDTDLTMAIQRRGWSIVYEDRARAWTEAPATFSALWRQRYRWAYGTLQAMWKHRGALRERSRLGVLGLPYMLLFQILLPLVAPAIDLFALYGIIFLNLWAVLGFWLAYNALGFVLALVAFRLDGERITPLWTLPLQQLVYRQLMYLVAIQSVVSAVVGVRLRWQKLSRVGLGSLAGVTD